MAQDIVIADDEFAAEAARVLKDAENAEEVLARLTGHLETMRDNGLIAGITANTFSRYCELVAGMKGGLSALADEEQRLITQMIAEVDEADQFLYGEQ